MDNILSKRNKFNSKNIDSLKDAIEILKEHIPITTQVYNFKINK